MPTLLVVDDEPSILHFFRRAFQQPDIRLETASSASEGLEKVRAEKPDVVVLDVNLGAESGLDVFRQIQQIDWRIPVIFITGHGTTAFAIQAMQLGAFEYLLKPLELDELTSLVQRAFEIRRLMTITPAQVPDSDAPDAEEPLVGRSAAMQLVYKSIGRVASQDVTVLILGESGTGKELVARAIYHYSRRATKPFVAVNCAAIPEALLESELFGHEKGAFTGADRRRIGKFELANGGTIFLDEIGDMSPVTQTKILRVIQGQDYERVGGNESLKSDVRIIAATNRDLEKMVAEEQFRGDLFYRLNVFTIRLPPLRERVDDIPLLANHFVRRFSLELGKEIHSIADQTIERLKQYSWPGNVREFQSVMKQALLVTTGPVLLPDFLPESIGAPPAAVANTDAAQQGLLGMTEFIQQRLQAESTSLYSEYQIFTERHLLTLVLKHTGGNLSRAARILGITRATLRSKLTVVGIDRELDGDATS